MTWFGSTCNLGAKSDPQAENSPAAKKEKPTGTIVRIICDLPDEIDKGPRTVRGNIGWSVTNAATGNTVTSGQTILFDLGKPSTEIQLNAFVPIHAEVSIRFTVTSTVENSKFKSGEWFTNVRAAEETRNTLTVRLSRFKYLDKNFVRTIAPGN